MKMKLNVKRTALVGLAFLSISAFWGLYDFTVPLILRDTYQLGDTFAGMVMAMDNIVALVLLPVFGALSDKCTHRLGRRMPFILFGTFAAAALALCTPLVVRHGSLGMFLAVLALLRRQIPLLTLGSEEAASLGVAIVPVRAAVLAAATLMACAVSAHAGVIAFSALIAPHGARLLLRGKSDGLALLSALVGGVLMLLADVTARLTPGAELPTSVFTTVLGAAMIVSLMAKGGRQDG